MLQDEPTVPLPCIESIEQPGRCVDCGGHMRRERQRAANHVFGGLLAPYAPPLSYGILVELRARAASPGGELDPWHWIARLLDALDLANAEVREQNETHLENADAELEFAAASRPTAAYALELRMRERCKYCGKCEVCAARADDLREAVGSFDLTVHEHPTDDTLEAWRSEADRWQRMFGSASPAGAQHPGGATALDLLATRVPTLIAALREARSANVELGRCTLEKAAELEQRLASLRVELSKLGTGMLLGRGGSSSGAPATSTHDTLTEVLDTDPDAPHGPVCTTLDNGCPDCLRLQRAAARKRAH